MDLQVQKRNELGSGKVVFLRGKGMIPAELYGHGVANIHLTVPVKDLAAAYKTAGESEIINLVVDGQNKPVIIHDIQFHPITQDFQSVDFYEVDMNAELELAIPFEFMGEAPAVKAFGGILTKAMDALEIVCLPANIPQHIVIDLSKLTELNQSIYVRDLAASDKYKIVTNPSTVIVSISEPVVEEVTPVAEVKIEDIKVEGEEKKAARVAAKFAAAHQAGGKEGKK